MFINPLHFVPNALFLGLLLLSPQSLLSPFLCPLILDIAVLILRQTESGEHRRVFLQFLRRPLVAVVGAFVHRDGTPSVLDPLQQRPPVLRGQFLDLVLCSSGVFVFAALRKDEHFDLSLAIMLHDGRVDPQFVHFGHTAFAALGFEPHDERLARTRNVGEVPLDIAVGSGAARRPQTDAIVRHNRPR